MDGDPSLVCARSFAQRLPHESYACGCMLTSLLCCCPDVALAANGGWVGGVDGSKPPVNAVIDRCMPPFLSADGG